MEKIEFNDDSFMPFGKHKGLRLADVPATHFIWLWENDRAGRLTDYIFERLAKLRACLPKTEMIRLGYKRKGLGNASYNFDPYKYTKQ